MISSKRREQTKKIINRRIRQLKIAGIDKITLNGPISQPHRLAKTPAFGCRRPGCRICHPGKYKKTKT